MRKGVCSRRSLEKNIKRKDSSHTCEKLALRLGKYEKQAKQAGIPFDVKVLTKVKSLIYILPLKDLGWPASG